MKGLWGVLGRQWKPDTIWVLVAVEMVGGGTDSLTSTK